MPYTTNGPLFGKQTVYTVEYMCRYCGMKTTRHSNQGRPMPGICSRRPKVGGRSMPHSWVINRRY